MSTNNIYGGVMSDGRSRVWAEAYDNITQFEKTISGRETQAAFEGSTNSKATGDKRTKFTHTANYEVANELLLNGDEDSKGKIDAHGVAKVLLSANRSERQRKTVLSPCGFLPHVPNFLAGRPNNMITERVQLQRKRVINVVYNTTAASTTKADDIQNTAAQVMSAILLCERGGLRVNLWSATVTKRGSKYVAVAIKIKDSAQHIDLLKMAYPMTHPSMLRRHVFRAIETMPGVPSGFVGTYGECVFNDSEVELCMSAVGINADCTLSFDRCQNMTREQIINEITKVNK